MAHHNTVFLQLLNPPPVHKIPIMIGSLGEKLGIRIVTEYDDISHVYGAIEVIAHKIEVMKGHCKEIGRDFNEMEIATWYFPHLLGKAMAPGDFLKLGIRNIINVQYGPRLGSRQLRELLEWRKSQVK